MKAVHRYLLYRGEKLLGVITYDHCDQPWEYGLFEPAPAFEQVRGLFAQEVELLHHGGIQSGEWEKVWRQIKEPGLRLLSEQTGHPEWTDILVHIDDKQVSWRGVRSRPVRQAEDPSIR